MLRRVRISPTSLTAQWIAVAIIVVAGGIYLTTVLTVSHRIVSRRDVGQISAIHVGPTSNQWAGGLWFVSLPGDAVATTGVGEYVLYGKGQLNVGDQVEIRHMGSGADLLCSPRGCANMK